MVISEVVLEEAKRGSPEAAQKRIALLEGLPLVAVTKTALDFANDLIQSGAVPQKAAQDALHISICCVNEVDFLLTWNCKHIANAEKRDHIAQICKLHNYSPPIICTPEELLGE